MKKIVYITGCLGFIGSHITRQCLNLGWQVRGVDKQTYAANLDVLNEFLTYDNFIYEKKDICDLDFLYDCDYIINTAAETHVDNSIAKSDSFIKSNINGVHNLVELIRITKKQKPPVLLHFSTDEVYGDTEEGSHTESCLLKPSNPYSASKAAADQLIIAWGRTYNIPYIIVRPTNNYGEGQYVEKLIPKAIKCLQVGQKIPLHSEGKPKRVWLHVKDTSDAVITIINSGVRNQIYNISGNYETENLEVIKSIVKYFHKTEDISNFVDFSFSRKGVDIRYSVDDSKLKSLGWEPTRDFSSEIESIVASEGEVFRW